MIEQKYNRSDLEEDYKVLNNVQETIKKFDNKAGILVSVIGIVFGLSIYFLDTLDKILNLKLKEIADEIISFRYCCFSIVYLIFLIVAILTIIFALLIFYPRKSPKNIDKNNINYYYDLEKMNHIEFEKKNNWKKDEDVVWKQIKINSHICVRKHQFLQASIILSFIFLILFIVLVILHILFVR